MTTTLNSRSLSLNNLRDIKIKKPITGVKYHLEYENNMFKLKPIPPPKPTPSGTISEPGIAIIELDYKKVARLFVNEFSHMINTE